MALKLLDTDDLAKLYKVPAGTIRKWRAQGDGPAGRRVGKHVRYDYDECVAWWNDRPTRPDPTA